VSREEPRRGAPYATQRRRSRDDANLVGKKHSGSFPSRACRLT
jgi:hypothetical protein